MRAISKSDQGGAVAGGPEKREPRRVDARVRCRCAMADMRDASRHACEPLTAESGAWG